MIRTALLLGLLAAPALADELPPALVVEYGYDNGTLPPDYREEFRVSIYSNTSATLTACRGYAPEGCVRRDAAVRDVKLYAIRRAAEASGLAERPAALNPEPPIGGGLRWGKVQWGELVVDLPALPAKADAARVGAVLDAIDAAIPEDERKAVIAAAEENFKEMNP